MKGTPASGPMGAVQRCFRTKQEMLVFALDHVGERVTERVTAQVNERAQPRTASGAGPTGSTLEQVLGEVALVDEARRTEARVWLAFVAQAAVTPELATVLRSRYAGLHPLLVRLLREIRVRVRVGPGAVGAGGWSPAGERATDLL
nr:TetR family transcriptional regulator C-terminal domain-containing protein [Streptomyces noursei]